MKIIITYTRLPNDVIEDSKIEEGTFARTIEDTTWDEVVRIVKALEVDHTVVSITRVDFSVESRIYIVNKG